MVKATRPTSSGPQGSTADPDEIRVGISSCLLGERVRFDGGHKRDAYLINLLGGFVRTVPVCPEVEIGMGIPREPIRLVRSADRVRLLGTHSGEDHTERMERHATRCVRALEKLDLGGYVLKRGSPSCGMERVKVYAASGMPARNGRGLFAAALLDRMSLLPVEDEGRLNDTRLRDNFVERIFAFQRLKNVFRGRWTVGNLVRFHTAEKMNLLAHDPATYRVLGRIVAAAAGMPREDVKERYQANFMAAMKKIATVKKNTSVLQHALGYIKKVIEADDRDELARLIQNYRAGLVPLVAPITLIRHHVRRHQVEDLAGQTYLELHPKELMLRNHA